MLPGRSRITCKIYVGHVSWVGFVLYRSCATSHDGRLGSRWLDDLDDLDDLDRHLFDVRNTGNWNGVYVLSVKANTGFL